MQHDGAIDVTEIDLESFADPDAQVILLPKASGGSLDVLVAIQEELRRVEGRGWCSILHMTNEIAVVRWYDQFVLNVTDDTLVMAGGDNV
jgi:hypothetical protein